MYRTLLLPIVFTSKYVISTGLSKVSTTYDFSRVHADDCKDCDIPDQGLIEKITSNVHIEGDFDEAQRKRLAQIAERCPVHKTLAHGITFEDNATFG